MSRTLEPVVGAIAEVPAGKGVVRYVGTTQFSTGEWVGIELAEPNGKNNGIVQGVQYFSCPPNYGIFVRPRQIISVMLPTSEARRVSSPLSIQGSSSTLRTPPTPARPTVGHKRTSSIGLTRAPSHRSPALSASTSRSVSPQKPGSTSGKTSPPAANGSTRFKVPNAPSPTKRASLSTSVSVQRPRAAAEGPTSPIVATTRRLAAAERTTSPTSASPSTSVRATSPPFPPEPGTPITFSAPSQNGRQSALGREISAIAEGELRKFRTRVMDLEDKSKEDARIMQSLRNQLDEASVFIKAKPIFQSKLNQLQQELIETKRSLADSQQLAALNENRVADSQEQLELCMLDKEVAEERAEAAESEVTELQDRIASMEVELESLRPTGDESASLDEDSPVKTHLAYIQLERHNERLKEALLRLREVSQETETEQRHQIAELEKELAGVDELHAQYEATLNNLQNAENHVDGLKMQLDDALGAEEMVVQLTERNLMLGEKIEEMRITIEDLESLKELSDELEESHVEAEKSLNEELHAKETELRDSARQISELEDSCQDYENTITQFRDLVLQLQTDVESLRLQTQSAQDESASAASQSAAIMSLNLKLQSTAAKNQARNIELEIRKIEARESKELLAIVQPYLPQIYVETDSDATNCYMFFQRLAAKADVINNVVAHIHGLPDSLSDNVSETLVGVCEMRGRVSTLSIRCKRFAAIMRRCSVEVFLNIGKIYQEVSPLEKRIDMHIDLLRREEFREMECVSDILKIQAQFEHIAETYFDGFDYDLGERELGYALALDNDLDMFIASIGLTKTALEAVGRDEDVAVESGDDLSADLLAPLQRLLDQCKGAKALSKKLVKRIEELVQESAALKAQLVPQLRALNNRVPELVNFGIQLAQTVMPLTSEIRNNKQTLSTKAILNLVQPIVDATVGKNESGDALWGAVGDAIATLVVEAGLVVPASAEAESVIKITAIAPWIHRVDEIKSTLAVNVEAERKVAQLNEENRGLARTIKEREQIVQESAVKIELMERRLDAVKKQADAIIQLENDISRLRKQEKANGEEIEQLHTELDKLEQENSKLKTASAGAVKITTAGAHTVEAEAASLEGNLETSYLLEQIDALRGTVRYFRRENSYLKGQDLLKEIRTLPPIPDFSRSATPEMDRSPSPTNSDDSDRPRTPPTLNDLATETSVLYREVLSYSSSPRIVDLSVVNKKRMESKRAGTGWMPKKLSPSHQLLERKMEGEHLKRKVQGLIERSSMLHNIR